MFGTTNGTVMAVSSHPEFNFEDAQNVTEYHCVGESGDRLVFDANHDRNCWWLHGSDEYTGWIDNIRYTAVGDDYVAVVYDCGMRMEDSKAKSEFRFVYFFDTNGFFIDLIH
jgi:hypothetical protein